MWSPFPCRRGGVAVPARGENRAPPPALTSKTNNDCQIKFKLLQLMAAASPIPLYRSPDDLRERLTQMRDDLIDRMVRRGNPEPEHLPTPRSRRNTPPNYPTPGSLLIDFGWFLTHEASLSFCTLLRG